MTQRKVLTTRYRGRNRVPLDDAVVEIEDGGGGASTASAVTVSPTVAGAANVQAALTALAAKFPYMDPTSATPEAIVLMLIAADRMEPAP